MALIDRIKWDGMRNGADWLVYRYWGEEFVTGTQLIVGEGQVAVFVKGGQALDYFTAGTYTLSTANIPLLRNIINMPFGGKTPFTAEVYFINKTAKLDIAWGTSDPIQLVDPKYNVKLRIRAFGQLGMVVDDYRVFLTQLIGALPMESVVQYGRVIEYFKGILIMKVKTLIAQAIIKNKTSALEISASLDEISDFCKRSVSDEFQRFGFRILNFYIKSINFPDEDFEEINKILRDKASFDIIGDQRYVTKRSFDTMETAAANEGIAGTLAGAGMGLGLGVGVGGVMGGIAPNLNTSVPVPAPASAPAPAAVPAPAPSVRCPACGDECPADAVFCSQCGTKLAPPKKTCPDCGKEVAADGSFCPYCGVPLNKKKSCPSCGAEAEPGMLFCGKCGTKLDGSKPETESKQ